MLGITVDGLVQEAKTDERLIDVINRTGSKVPQVCYHPQLGPIQTCDTCMVEVDGKLVRACATTVSAGMSVKTNSPAASDAQREAFDRILSNHMLLLDRTAACVTSIPRLSRLGSRTSE